MSAGPKQKRYEDESHWIAQEEVKRRLDGIKDAQSFRRWTMVASMLCSFVLFAAIWSENFGWDRWHSTAVIQPQKWGEAQEKAEIIKQYVDSLQISIPVLGIKLSNSDAAVLGSLALVAAAYLSSLAAQRWKRELVTIVNDFGTQTRELRQMIYSSVRTGAVFTAVYDEAGKGDEHLTEKDVSIPYKIIIFLPVVALAAILLDDFFYIAHHVKWQGDHFLFGERSVRFLWEMAGEDLIALVLGVFLVILCRKTLSNDKEAQRKLFEFGWTSKSH